VLRRYRPQDFEGTSAFPDVPRFDGRDYELFHAEMVAYNNILKEKRRKNRSGNFEAWEMVSLRVLHYRSCAWGWVGLTRAGARNFWCNRRP